MWREIRVGELSLIRIVFGLSRDGFRVMDRSGFWYLDKSAGIERMKKIIFNVLGTVFFVAACYKGYLWYSSGKVGESVTSVVDKVVEEKDALIEKRMDKIRAEAEKRLEEQRANDPEVIAYKKEKAKFDLALGSEVGDDRAWYMVKKNKEQGQSVFCDLSDGPKPMIDLYNKQQEVLGKPKTMVIEDHEVEGVIVISTFAGMRFFRGKERCERFISYFQDKDKAESNELKRYE